MFRSKKEPEEYKDLTKEIVLPHYEEKSMVLRFFKVTEKLETKDIFAAIKKQKVVCFVDISELLEDHGVLRIFVNKVKRLSESYSVTMKLYKNNWLIILPENVVFQVGEE